ncbi:Regulatory protein recX [Rothia dentocariosa]|uniref:Regulatory protein RecX n=1 Tax=Rothia dentocariosa TaxID=2047 RepID=A0A448USW5_9MICC|nr:Regulatory protein recX [Rothia dentocariosa]
MSTEEEALIRGIAAEEKTNVPGTNRSGRWKQREEPDPYRRAKILVYNQLAYSAKSRAQLQKKLADKGFEESLIEPLLDKFEAAHLIDDAEYAHSFVEQRGKHKKLSLTALRRELKERGITGELAEDALAARTDEDERQDAAELVRKKLRPSMNFSDRTEKEKIMRRLVGMLARRGYSSSVAFSVVKEEIERYRSEQEEDC